MKLGVQGLIIHLVTCHPIQFRNNGLTEPFLDKPDYSSNDINDITEKWKKRQGYYIFKAFLTRLVLML